MTVEVIDKDYIEIKVLKKLAKPVLKDLPTMPNI